VPSKSNKYVQRAKYSPPPKKGDVCDCTRQSLAHSVGEITHLYPYFDENGIRQFSRTRHLMPPSEKYPKGDKTFRYCHHYRKDDEQGFRVTDPKNESLLYGQHKLIDAILAAEQPKVILLTEGEGCCEACWALLDMHATTTHLGKRFTEASAEHFRGYKGTVLIVVDKDHEEQKHIDAFNDEKTKEDYPGSAAALRKWKALKKIGVRVFFREAAVGKDLRDHLEAGKTFAQLKKVTLDEVQPLWLADVDFGHARGRGDG